MALTNEQVEAKIVALEAITTALWTMIGNNLKKESLGVSVENEIERIKETVVSSFRFPKSRNQKMRDLVVQEIEGYFQRIKERLD